MVFCKAKFSDPTMVKLGPILISGSSDIVRFKLTPNIGCFPWRNFTNFPKSGIYIFPIRLVFSHNDRSAELEDYVIASLKNTNLMDRTPF
jgi:hypothetical protein